jgi:hypothetical protein
MHSPKDLQGYRTGQQSLIHQEILGFTCRPDQHQLGGLEGRSHLRIPAQYPSIHLFIKIRLRYLEAKGALLAIIFPGRAFWVMRARHQCGSLLVNRQISIIKHIALDEYQTASTRLFPGGAE